MATTEQYRAQAQLLVQLLPSVAEEGCFALKGGTAINMFVQDLPRLSVDIDLIYLPLEDRPNALAGIDAAMRRIGERITSQMREATVAHSIKEGTIVRLVVQVGQTQVKIEVSPVLRGVVYKPQTRKVTPAVENRFGFAEMQIVSFADLYAGKIVAALDRQHPRDLFDVHILFAREGVDDALRKALLIYLVSHNRPMWEVLSGGPKDIEQAFLDSFEGMTDEPLTPTDLQRVQHQLAEELVAKMPDPHREFLIGFEAGVPDWGIFESGHVANLPAVRWRQMNLDKIDASVRSALVENLKNVLPLKAPQKSRDRGIHL